MAQEDQTDLPKVNFYLIHPALTSLISKQRRSNDYIVSQYVIVGHNLPWEDWYGVLLNIECQLDRVPDSSFASAARQCLNWMVQHLQTGQTAGFRDTDVEPHKWHDIARNIEVAGQDELLLWFEELIDILRTRKEQGY
jgi:hypothetical protein